MQEQLLAQVAPHEQEVHPEQSPMLNMAWYRDFWSEKAYVILENSWNIDLRRMCLRVGKERDYERGGTIRRFK